MRTEIYQSKESVFGKFEAQYRSETPYVEQSASWKAGMRYRYSPDRFVLNERDFNSMKEAGQVIGSELDRKYPGQMFEFRIDYVRSYNDSLLYITEVQTDDRGIPAVANTRNAVGPGERFPGVVKTFGEELQRRTERKQQTLLILYPQEEEFYYAGFLDYANLLRGNFEDMEVVTARKEQIEIVGTDTIELTPPLSGLTVRYSPSYTWDFSDSTSDQLTTIQPAINKDILLDLTQQGLDIPLPTTVLPCQEIQRNKDTWILKPIDGRWSEGVVIGQETTQADWVRAIEIPGIIAQRYIQPSSDSYYVRKAEYDFQLKRMFSRVEGYYVKNSKTDSWKLADVLATCTPDYPVHGKRECIMIPGIVSSKDI